MSHIRMISGELSPYQCNGGLGIAVENMSAQLVAMGATTEVFFPSIEKFNNISRNTQGIIPSAINVPLDMTSQPDSELAPGLTIFCQKALSLMTKQQNYFVAHDNEAAVSVIIGKTLDFLPVFWLHSLYDHPVRSDFPKSIKKMFNSESLLASAINDSHLFVTSRGVLQDALSVEWPYRLQEVQKAIQDADQAKKIIIVESLGLLKERCVSTLAHNVANKYGLAGKSFILFPSRPVLSKGIGFFESIAKIMRGSNIVFVAVGNPSDEVRSMCKNILWIPWLKKEELFALMAQAVAIIHPSLTEGYGLAAAESTKFNNNVFCHPVGGLQILVERQLAHAVPLTKNELKNLYNLWSDLLSAKSRSEAVTIWHEQSVSFNGLIEKWVDSLFRRFAKIDSSSKQDQQKGDASWQFMTWGESLLQAIVKP